MQSRESCEHTEKWAFPKNREGLARKESRSGAGGSERGRNFLYPTLMAHSPG